MKTDYLLPCAACGEKLRVDTSQAGLTLTCRCGAQVTVPTLRGLSQLERDTSVVAAPVRVWGAQQRAMLAGIVLLLVGLSIAIFSWLIIPNRPVAVVNTSEIEREVNDLPIEELFAYFDMLNEGLDRTEMVAFTLHRYAVGRGWRYITFGLVLAGAGVLALIAAAVMKLQKPPKPVPARPAAR